MSQEIPTITLNDGVEVPVIGFGTGQIKGEAAVSSVSSALSIGYRLLDTAFNYENEGAVGAGSCALVAGVGSCAVVAGVGTWNSGGVAPDDGAFLIRDGVGVNISDQKGVELKATGLLAGCLQMPCLAASTQVVPGADYTLLPTDYYVLTAHNLTMDTTGKVAGEQHQINVLGGSSISISGITGGSGCLSSLAPGQMQTMTSLNSSAGEWYCTPTNGNVVQGSSATPSGTCTANGFITTSINGTAVKLATCAP